MKRAKMIKQNGQTKYAKNDSNELTEPFEEKEQKEGEAENEGESETNEDKISSADEDDDDDELLMEDEQIETMEKLDIEFEALPPAEEDLEDIEGLLTQIFLRADIDKRSMAKALIAQSPMGCVYRPVEECEDDEAESIAYGVLSIVPLNGAEKFQTSIVDFLLQRAKKYSDGETFKKFEKVLPIDQANQSKVGFLVNERLLHFPAQVAGPAFSSLCDDYKKLPKSEHFEQILMILKIRICEESASSSADASTSKKSNRKLGKAARKRKMAAQLAEAEALFDNSEEQLLFTTQRSPAFPFFQYPVESEVERSSKFHSVRRGGRIFRPFRRVCLLSQDQFFAFSNSVSQSFGTC